MKGSRMSSMAAIIIVILSGNLSASEFRVQQIPNGAKFGCLNCHISSAGGGARNSFGQLVEQKYLDSQGNVKWGAALAAEDADKDGFTNGQELQDPAGTWKAGQANPGNSSLVTLPGNSNSKPTAIEKLKLEMPVTYKLEQNYPNPFNPTTTISFSLPAAGFTSLIVYDVSGKEIKSLINEELQAGNYSQKFNADGLSSGIYFYQIKSKDFLQTKKFVLLK